MLDFTTNCLKLIDVKPILSAKMYLKESSFWQYMTYEDIPKDYTE